MKFRMLLSALLLAAGLVFVAGCGNKTEAKTEKKADTPTDVAKKIAAAKSKLDFAAIVTMCDGEAKKNAEEGAKELEGVKAAAAKGDATAKQQLEMLGAMFAKTKCEVKSEKIEGDYAVLDTVVTDEEGKAKEDKWHFKKVGGEWKHIDKKDYKPAQK